MISQAMVKATELTILKYKDAIKKIGEKEPEDEPQEYLYECLDFADPNSCLLCQASKDENKYIECTNCVWYDPESGQIDFSIEPYPCIKDNYNKLNNVKTYEELTVLLKKRIKLLKKRLEIRK